MCNHDLQNKDTKSVSSSVNKVQTLTGNLWLDDLVGVIAIGLLIWAVYWCWSPS